MNSNLLAMLILTFIILGSILILKGMNIKKFISLIFIIYFVFLVNIVTSPQIIYYDSNFRPFKEIFRYHFLSPLFIKNIIGNIILFIPMGIYLTYKLKIKLFYIILLSLYFSLVIEITQLLIDRVFDIDDIILNVIGSLLGYLIFKAIDEIKKI